MLFLYKIAAVYLCFALCPSLGAVGAETTLSSVFGSRLVSA